ncbi:MAG: thiamine diphosphokinase [Bacteroidales bacterium]|nr:thiamine diphosphokinase [Bacteroidales bacterium]
MNITIVANGLFPSGEWVDGLLQQSDRIVCCDGALEKYIEWRRGRTTASDKQTGVTVVGDGDSLRKGVLEQAAALGVMVNRVVVSEQDDNDLTKATRYALNECCGEPPTVSRVDYIGATGLREDHTVGNISLLAWYMEQYPDVQFRMLSDCGIFVPMSGHAVFNTHKGQQVSLFSLTPSIPVTTTGLRWPIKERCLDWWWEGTLNEALGGQVEVWGGKMVVYLLTGEPPIA